MRSTLTNIKRAFNPERQEMSKKYCKILGDVLNEVHATHLSDRFWEFVLGGYVNSVISKIEIYKHADVKLPITIDYQNGFTFPSIFDNLKTRLIRIVKESITKSNKRKIHKVLKEYNEIHVNFPKLNQVDEDLGVRIPDYRPMYRFAHSKPLRSKLDKVINERGYSTLESNMIRFTPKLYVEGFVYIFNQIPLHEPTQKTFHLHGATSSFQKFLIGKYFENGAKLIWYQHGSNYGEMKYGAHIKERRLADKYRTWGWRMEDKDEPWKAYRLIKFKCTYETYNQENKFDILITLGTLRHTHENKQLNYILSTINRKKSPNILIRPRPNNRVFSRKSKYKQLYHFDNINISDGLKSIQSDMIKSKLIVQLKVPSTNFLECLFVNHPTVGILDNDQPTNIILLYYDFFIKVGVLHYSIESLVKHLNGIKDVDGWWNTIIQNKVYHDFKTNFANAN